MASPRRSGPSSLARIQRRSSPACDRFSWHCSTHQMANERRQRSRPASARWSMRSSVGVSMARRSIRAILRSEAGGVGWPADDGRLCEALAFSVNSRGPHAQAISPHHPLQGRSRHRVDDRSVAAWAVRPPRTPDARQEPSSKSGTHFGHSLDAGQGTCTVACRNTHAGGRGVPPRRHHRHSGPRISSADAAQQSPPAPAAPHHPGRARGPPGSPRRSPDSPDCPWPDWWPTASWRRRSSRRLG